MSILDFVPAGFTLREVQKKALLDIEKAWKSYDVIVVPGPVAFGKSLVGTTLALWCKSFGQSTAYLTSQVILQEQLAKTPPYFPVLKGRNRYQCKNFEQSTCEDTYDLIKRYCADCPYNKAKRAAVDSPVGVFNFHSYLFNKAHKDVLFVDEAHNLLSMITEFYTLKVWKHKIHYPQLNSKGDVAVWLESQIKAQTKSLDALIAQQDPDKRKEITDAQRLLERFRTVYFAVDRSPADFFVEQTTEEYRGRKLEVLKIRPLTIRNIHHNLWPADKVSKILLSSATLREMDIDDLGLNFKKVAYLECESPIPVENRPFIFIPVANMGFKYQKKNAPKMANYLMDLASKHSKTKGIVHMPYSMRWLLKPYLKGSRWMWHDQDSKEKTLADFLKTSQNKILVAHGMDQGIDLAGPEFGWQAIVKVQWPSLGDGLVAAQARERPEWYVWQTVRVILQQYGRICRTPTDSGTTYMLDTGFRQLAGRAKHLWPQWFKDALTGDF